MRLEKVRWAAAGIVSAALAAAMGCGGSGGNNDQGIVFRATGIFRGPEQIDERITCTEPNTDNSIVDAAFELSLSRVPAFPDRFNPFGDPCGGYIAMENNLAQLNINVQSVM